ncbi:RNA-binding protein rnc1 OS=Schizosaccharomyces pombe (strain 972 / ATCC 24843) GN=rnc1 PE=1 SV=1 [Rhizoctonia solani AG-1 IB]|uniref:RNA-binding protein rnc1 n=1 Tax=Thanatephorus cucumeris (strain AG1-IB / isolate 7/3/14) TaxID=1108050 RepID=A0A0B7FPN2_THACB|nr:RNA-binding protein rnc1 OS=Schizosaccharomyces pombe (strain 972 / ATCC 24843) GN=rnc1 PE=1 SV=1 [Rhizoctonia solani AG-1 IB]
MSSAVPNNSASPTPAEDQNTNSRPTSPADGTAQNNGPESDTLTLRALVTTKEAGVIIGKGGKNVADLREQTGVKAGVSKVVQGVNERVLSVSGTVEDVAKAYTLIITQLLQSAPSSPGAPPPPPTSTHTSLRLLISHNLMGTIIGRGGLKIKAIQDNSGARMVASKEMLPQSTERVVEVQGSSESIGRAIAEIGRCLLEDWERGLGTVLYHPGPGTGADPLGGTGARRNSGAFSPSTSTTPRRISSAADNVYSGASNRRSVSGMSQVVGNNSPPSRSPPPSQTPPAALRTQNISIPSDMVGCIIGRAGSKITEIRRLSGSKISIAKTPHDETGERMFTIVGTPDANEKALFLLYNQLESEKERRVGREAVGE